MQTYNKSMIASLSKIPHVSKRSLSATIFILSIFTFTLFFFASIVKIMDLLSIDERILIDAALLVLSILLFIAIFWNETGGDFFSFINITLCWYFVFYVACIFVFLYLPDASVKKDYWDMPSFEYAVWIVIISLYSLCMGYKLAGKLGANMVIPLSQEPNMKRIKLYIIISFFSLLISHFIISSIMGASVFDVIGLKESGTKYTEREYQLGIYTTINFITSFFSFTFLICFLVPRGKKGDRKVIWFANAYIVFYTIYAIISAVIQLKKTRVVSLGLMLIAIMHYIKRPIKLIELFCLSLFGSSILILFNYLRARSAMDFGDFRISYIFAFAYLNSFEAFEHLCILISRFNQGYDYYFGKILFEELFYLVIPRAIWEGKPVAYGSRAILYDINPDYFYSGYHTGLQGQFYADFGLAGVIIGFAIFGAMMKFVYNVFRNNQHNTGIVILYVIILTQAWLFLTGGFPWFNILIMNIIPLYFVLLYIYPVLNKK